jgi:hypothetical protein
MRTTHPPAPSLAKRRGAGDILHPLSWKKDRGIGGEFIDEINPIFRKIINLSHSLAMVGLTAGHLLCML